MADDEITRIRVGRHPSGIIGLKKVLAEVAEGMRGAPDETIQEELLGRLSKRNYIHASARERFGLAFLREYKKFIGEPFLEEGPIGIEIKVLGMGCPRCDQLERDLMGLLAEMNVKADLEHVRELEEIRRYGVMGSPAVVINGDVKAVGVVPPRAELRALIEQAVNSQKPKS